MDTPRLRILLIGNSLTYVCDVPEDVSSITAIYDAIHIREEAGAVTGK